MQYKYLELKEGILCIINESYVHRTTGLTELLPVIVHQFQREYN